MDFAQASRTRLVAGLRAIASATTLPQSLAELYAGTRPAILERLAEFAAVPRTEWFYELCYCLLTPQSKAVHAGAVVDSLKNIGFFESGGDALHLLRNKDTYIRFHNTKHKRLHALREQWSAIESVLDHAMQHRKVHSPGEVNTQTLTLRDSLVDMVGGIGMKEASHFLRNIGFRGMAIIDRHLLTNMLRCGLYAELPPLSTRTHYRAVEARYLQFADAVEIDPDELDLLFWSAQTGVILK